MADDAFEWDWGAEVAETPGEAAPVSTEAGEVEEVVLSDGEDENEEEQEEAAADPYQDAQEEEEAAPEEVVAEEVTEEALATEEASELVADETNEVEEVADEVEMTAAEKAEEINRKEMELHLGRAPPPEKGKGKDKGKGKGKGKGKDRGGKDKGKAKGNDRGKGKDNNQGKGKEKDAFFGLVYQEIPATKTLLVKSWKVEEEFGYEAVIPKWNNPAKAKIGDKIGFDVEELIQEGEGEPRPMATKVRVREQVDEERKRQLLGSNKPTDVPTQLCFYLSDENLRKDKFFHDIISSTDGGWLGVDVILGCRRMKQLGASKNTILAAADASPDLEARRKAGQEAVRRMTPPPPLEVDDSGKGAKGAKGGKTQNDKKSTISPSTISPIPANGSKPEKQGDKKGAVSKTDLFYAGIVARQQKFQPHKFFITCEAMNEQFGFDAFFLPDQKPATVEVGSLVAFTVPPDSVVGKSPQAGLVVALAPLGEAVLQAAQGEEAGEEEAPEPIMPSQKILPKKRSWDGSGK